MPLEDPRKDKRHSKAWAISDRSGQRHKLVDMIREPGTGYLIHRDESDGIWNMVDHPLANLQKWAEFGGDPYPVINARPDRNWAMDYELQDFNLTDLTDGVGTKIDIGKEDPLV